METVATTSYAVALQETRSMKTLLRKRLHVHRLRSACTTTIIPVSDAVPTLPYD